MNDSHEKEYYAMKPSEESGEVIWCPRGRALEMVDHPIFKMKMANLLNFSGIVYYSAYTSQPFELLWVRYF